MAQVIKFILRLSLPKNYIYGTAALNGNSYLINIQQAKNQSTVVPQIDFSDISSQTKYQFLLIDKDNNRPSYRYDLITAYQKK
jgi:hypothetical protein